MSVVAEKHQSLAADSTHQEVATTVAPVSAPARARTVIEKNSQWSALNLKEIWAYRDLLITLAGRDVKLRYKQTALGIVWVILQPLLAAGIFAFVFGKVLKAPSD